MENVLKTLEDLKIVIESAVILCERPSNGVDKKKRVLELVHQFIKFNDVKLPFSQEFFDILVGYAIDWFVKWMNETVWKKDEKAR